MGKFINLRNNTHFSLQLGVGTIEDHFNAAKKTGQLGLCLTDNHSLAGGLEAYFKAKDKKLGLVLGVNLYVTEDINVKDQDNKYNRQIVYIKNEMGYKTLSRLISTSFNEDSFYYKPRISIDDLLQNKEGLIVTSSCINSVFGHHFTKNAEFNLDEDLFKMFSEAFGDDFYGELSLTDLSYRWNIEHKKFVQDDTNPQAEYNKRIIELSKKYGVKLILTMPSFMPSEDFYGIQTITIKNSPGSNGWHFHEPQHHLSREQMINRASRLHPYLLDIIDEALDNTEEVFNKCKNLTLKFKPVLPKINYEESGILNDELLSKKMNEIHNPEWQKLVVVSKNDKALDLTMRLVLKHNKIDLNKTEYIERLCYELKTVQRNGVIKLCDYFLLLEDITRFVKSNGYLRGYGRGSGASSVLVYALDISDVDPIKHNLPFERFMTLNRIGKYNFKFSEVL